MASASRSTCRTRSASPGEAGGLVLRNRGNRYVRPVLWSRVPGDLFAEHICHDRADHSSAVLAAGPLGWPLHHHQQVGTGTRLGLAPSEKPFWTEGAEYLAGVETLFLEKATERFFRRPVHVAPASSRVNTRNALGGDQVEPPPL